MIHVEEYEPWHQMAMMWRRYAHKTICPLLGTDVRMRQKGWWNWSAIAEYCATYGEARDVRCAAIAKWIGDCYVT